jgi:hypothetical protein
MSLFLPEDLTVRAVGDFQKNGNINSHQNIFCAFSVSDLNKTVFISLHNLASAVGTERK